MNSSPLDPFAVPPPVFSFDCRPNERAYLYRYAGVTLLIAVAIGLFAWQMRLPWLGAVSALVLFLAWHLALSFRLDVDPAAGTLRRVSLLFGRWPVRAVVRRCTDFVGIGYRRAAGDEESFETVWLGFIRPNGSLWVIGYFGAGERDPRGGAEFLARDLSEATGLEIRGTAIDPGAPVRSAPPFITPATHPAVQPRRDRFRRQSG